MGFEEMKDEREWTNVRPAGEWILEMYRSPTRFGWALKMGVKALDGKFWVARTHHGCWEFTEHERNVQAPDAFFFDDMMIEQLRSLVNNVPKPLYETSAATSYLQDIIRQRDNLLEMVDKLRKLLVQLERKDSELEEPTVGSS